MKPGGVFLGFSEIETPEQKKAKDKKRREEAAEQRAAEELQQRELREQQERARREQEAKEQEERVNGMSEERFLRTARELESGARPLRPKVPENPTMVNTREVAPTMKSSREEALKELQTWHDHMRRQDPTRSELTNITVKPIQVGKRTLWTASGDYSKAAPKPQSASRQ